MRRLVEVLGRTPHRYIVSKGPQHDEYELAANMWGEEFLPQPSMLPLVDLVITHGGNNTTTECFHFGKPMVVLPLFWDQYDNAQRVDETGFGVRLPTYDFVEADADRRRSTGCWPTPICARRMTAIAARLQAAPGTVRAADLIERVAADAEELAAARWFGGKAGTITSVELEDRLELGAGAELSILLVTVRSLRLERGPGRLGIAQPGPGPGGDRCVFRHTGVTPVEAGERAIGLDQTNTSLSSATGWSSSSTVASGPASIPRSSSADTSPRSPPWTVCPRLPGRCIGATTPSRWCRSTCRARRLDVGRRRGHRGRGGRHRPARRRERPPAARSQSMAPATRPRPTAAWRADAEAQLERVLAIVPADVAAELVRTGRGS